MGIANKQISGSVAVTTAELPQVYASSYASNAALAAATAVQVFSAASNVNGAIVHAASMTTYFAAGSGMPSLLAKATAPANTADGAVLLTVGGGATSSLFNSAKLDRPIKIPAGVGLYFISGAAEGAGLRGVLYSLL